MDRKSWIMSPLFIWMIFNSVIGLVTGGVSKNETISISEIRENFLKFDAFSELSCDDTGGSDKLLDKSSYGGCEMYINNATINTLLKKIQTRHYKFIHILLRFIGTGNANFTKCVIQPQEWVWAFPGYSGGTIQHHLSWPPQYRIWSLGLLTEDVLIESFPIDIYAGDTELCPIVIGQMNTTARIAGAITNMAYRMNNEFLFQLTEKHYKTTYFCYKTRIFIREHLLYMLCLHTICPIEVIGYKCCRVAITRDMAKKPEIYCSDKVLRQSNIWSVLPVITGLLLCIYFPIFLLKFCSAVYAWIHLRRRRHLQGGNIGDGEELYLLKSTREKHANEWLSFNPISVWWILSQPVRRVCDTTPVTGSRLCRLTFALLSLSIIVVKIVLHGIYQADFVIASVHQGSPMDFLSVLAGHELAKKNFLPDFGGPLTATGFYIVGVVVFMCVPNDLSKVLARGLPQNTMSSISLSPLFVSVADRQRLTFNIETESNGYCQLSRTMVANFFMLLNPSFTVYVFKVQVRRLKSMVSYLTGNDNCIVYVVFVALLPCYVAVCVLEILLCVIFYGMPMLFLMFVIVRGYCIGVRNRVRTQHVCFKYILLLFIPLMVMSLTYVVYMLNIVFVDSFLFLSRVAIFTYTGLFAYTTQSSGYFVLGFTVIMYVGESIHKLKTVYSNIFQKLLELCKIHKDNNETSRVYTIVDDVDCIPSDLFMQVVNKYQPLRVQLFKAVLKITIISIVLYLSVELLVSFEKFQELSALTQAVTTVFVCSVPKMINILCKRDKTRDQHKWKRTLSRFIIDYCRELDAISVSDHHNEDILVGTL